MEIRFCGGREKDSLCIGTFSSAVTLYEYYYYCILIFRKVVLKRKTKSLSLLTKLRKTLPFGFVLKEKKETAWIPVFVQQVFPDHICHLPTSAPATLERIEARNVEIHKDFDLRRSHRGSDNRFHATGHVLRSMSDLNDKDLPRKNVANMVPIYC